MIFDSHAHYDDSRFDGDLDDLFNRVFKEKGVCGAITCGTNLQSSKQAVAIAEKYDNIYASVGVYPEDIVDTVDLDALKALAARKKVVAIGEIGLEYHYEGVDRAIQKREFERQTELANELSLPIIVHDREHNSDTLDIYVELSPEQFSDIVANTQKRERSLEGAMRTMLGIGPKVHLVPPKSIERSEGKAKRVIDKRNLILK